LEGVPGVAIKSKKMRKNRGLKWKAKKAEEGIQKAVTPPDGRCDGFYN